MIYNSSILTGQYIEKLKISKTIPIFKKGSKLLTSNYRPISLLSNLNKIMEKLIFNRLYEFLETFNCLYNLQFGFRSKHSTTHALINITENIRSALDSKKIVCGIFVDLQKAFDTVNHDILLKKLNYYGIRGCMNDWFKSYLQNRKQIVSINGYESDINTIKHGVPQGSVLGPLLFLLYINDLHICIKNSTVYHFADDTNLLHINSTYKKLQKSLNMDLKNLCNWLLANKISLNCTKTELIFFHKPNVEIPNNIKIKIDGKRLIPSNSIKYLGIYLDETLSGKAHLNVLAKKLLTANSMLAKCRNYLKEEELLSIYYALFSSHLTYGAQIWGQSIDKYMNNIFTLQKNALRIMSFSEFRSSSSPLFSKYKILKINDYITLSNCLLVHDYLNNKLPKSFENTFQKLEELIPITTRNSKLGCLFIPSIVSTRYGINSITRKSIISWNFFANKFKETKICNMTRYKLKNEIKDYFISTY